MRELKLRYIIELLSDLGSKSKKDAQALAEAQKQVQQALGDTTNRVGLVEKALLRMGGVGSASAQRQAEYLTRLALRYHDVRRAAEGAVGAMQKAGQVAAGLGAAGWAADRMTRTPMEYSQRLAMMANTAFSDRDVAGRIKGKAVLDAAIRAATRTGGGRRDDAAGALDFVIASGAVTPDVAMRMLPMIMKGSTASGATPEAIAGIGVRAMQSFGIGIDQLPTALNMALVAGQAGGFELRDMAKWLPQAMASGRQSGLGGIEGFRRILASMQASVITAGSKDEAGNNLINLLNKINSQDTSNDFKKLGIDLTGELAKGTKRGELSIDTFVGLVDRVVGKDPRFKALSNKLQKEGNTGTDTPTTVALQALFQGAGIGKVVQDRQALLALVAEMNNRKYVQDVLARTRGEPGAMDTAFGVMAQETEVKRQQLLNEGANAASESFDRLKPAIDKVFETGTKLAQQFPMLTASVVAATGALSVLAAAAFGGGAVGRMLGGGAAGAAAAGAAGAAGAAAGSGRLALLGRAGLYGGAAIGAYQVWRLGGALQDWYEAANRDTLGNGVQLSRDSLARLGIRTPDQRTADAMRDYYRGELGMQGLGEGRLAVDVRVSDERATATTTVTKPLPIVRIDAGNTNPAGYGRP